MPTISAAELNETVTAALVAAGASLENAAIVADHLVAANLSGVDTHGVWHLVGYVQALHDGLIDGVASPTILRESQVSALVSGHWTFGHVAAKFATERGIERALETGVAAVGLVQCHHIGRLGHYPELAAERGVLCQVWAGGYSEEAPATVPFGGRARLLHTNPISMGFPAGAEPRMMFDFATTAMSGVKIDEARRRGDRLPPGAIVDKTGQPSTDPNDFYDGGGHIPFGGHKGYGLNMAAEFFGRILTGANNYADPDRAGPIMRNQGVTFILIREDVFTSSADYQARADEMERRTRAIPPAAGFASVLVPGDPERNARQARTAAGIPIDDELWSRIQALPR